MVCSKKKVDYLKTAAWNLHCKYSIDNTPEGFPPMIVQAEGTSWKNESYCILGIIS